MRTLRANSSSLKLRRECAAINGLGKAVLCMRLLDVRNQCDQAMLAKEDSLPEESMMRLVPDSPPMRDSGYMSATWKWWMYHTFLESRRYPTDRATACSSYFSTG